VRWSIFSQIHSMGITREDLLSAEFNTLSYVLNTTVMRLGCRLPLYTLSWIRYLFPNCSHLDLFGFPWCVSRDKRFTLPCAYLLIREIPTFVRLDTLAHWIREGAPFALECL